ncbi:MAG TPA: hypothetical protein V6C72_14990 [Chroococcales cyanobacterium]
MPVLATTAQDEVDLANKLAKQGCYDSAVIFYDKALSFTPGYGPAIAGRAAALRALKKGGKKAAATASASVDTAREAVSAQDQKEQRERDQQRKAKERKHKEELARQKEELAKQKEASARQKADQKTASLPPLKSEASKPDKAKAQPPTVKEPAAAHPGAAAMARHETTKPEPARPEPWQSEPVKQETVKPEPPKQESPANLSPIRSESATSTARVSESSTAGAAPPLSNSGKPHVEPGAYTSDDAVPGWLIGTAVVTFVLLIVLSAVWLTPSLSSSRQLHRRLKGLERSRDER